MCVCYGVRSVTLDTFLFFGKILFNNNKNKLNVKQGGKNMYMLSREKVKSIKEYGWYYVRTRIDDEIPELKGKVLEEMYLYHEPNLLIPVLELDMNTYHSPFERFVILRQAKDEDVIEIDAYFDLVKSTVNDWILQRKIISNSLFEIVSVFDNINEESPDFIEEIRIEDIANYLAKHPTNRLLPRLRAARGLVFVNLYEDIFYANEFETDNGYRSDLFLVDSGKWRKAPCDKNGDYSKILDIAAIYSMPITDIELHSTVTYSNRNKTKFCGCELVDPFENAWIEFCEYIDKCF